MCVCVSVNGVSLIGCFLCKNCSLFFVVVEDSRVHFVGGGGGGLRAILYYCKCICV